ncbi:MAG TPA: TonB-dependent receptor [Candidatus Limnocylindrales bacterium]|nr:TonB-dependent receptor [Candidatus Limnocylindrales bacterium]
MRKLELYLLAVALLFLCGIARATVFGNIRGIAHDPQHRPIPGATVTVKAKDSDWTKTATTDSNGEFLLNGVPIGEYVVTVTSPGFAPAQQDVVVESGTEPVLHFPLSLAGKNESVTVSGVAEVQPTDTATPITLVSRQDIDQTPGADRTNSLAMITDYVPGAYMTHDMLHMRGGHQTTWLLDGVPVVNTAIAVNVGPQFDPQDIDYLEVDRGSYGAEYGDRTYGVFNVVPRTGFESNNEGELTLTAGNFYQTDAHLSFGSHTSRFAYYASINGNRSDLGLEPPIPDPVHDAANGFGGFGSLIFNVNSSNQLRLVTSLRRDYFQIPYDPNPNDIENGSIPENDFTPQWPSIGLRDNQREADVGIIFSWVHTFSEHLMTTVSPFYHYNSGDYTSSPNDVPVATTENRGSTYAGGQATVQTDFARNNLQAGFFSFYERDNDVFGAIFNDGSGNAPISDVERPDADLETFFIDDKFQPFSWMTLSAGMRPTRFSGNYANGVNETSISPRFGATFTVPRLRWTFRAFYGHYYQAPPLETASGPALIDFAQSQGLTFISLPGEYDEEHQFGVDIPFRGWVLDIDNFRTNVSNFLDHNNIGASSIFFPITVSQAVIRGWEATLRSPLIARRGRIHLAYSNQIAEGSGTITGGLTDFTVFPELGALDHDQRNTLNVGGEVTLPWQSFASTNVYYGSGFANGFPDQPYPGDYLPGHTTFDLSLGKDFGERFSASLNALNVANRRVELDNSLTFGGFHWNMPREIYVEIRYKFHY